MAYVVSGSKSGKNEQVRVISHKTSTRVLLKGFEGKVTCIMFRGSDDNQLACMDMIGNIRVFSIFEANGELKYQQLVELIRRNMHKTEHSLVKWAPSMFDDANDDDENTDLILAITHNEKAEVLSIRTILEQHGNEGTLEDIFHGKKTIHNGHGKPITQIVIAPNLEVLATCSLDGFVKMWNICFDEEEDPRCLHEWRPHNGEPVSSLFFCDNHLAQEENISSWRFLVTGTRYNSELKVWCSVSWTCLQTLRFSENPQMSPSEERNPVPRLKAALDESGTFLILSDVTRQVLYVLQLFQNAEEGTCHFISLTECILTQPMLSFSLYQSKAVKKLIEGEHEDEEESEDKDTHDSDHNGILADNGDTSDFAAGGKENDYQVSLKMFAIHDKALQKLHIRYTPSCSVPPPTPSVYTAVSSEDHISVRDAMSDMAESQESARSNHEDSSDSFATATLNVPSAVVNADSSTSSITTISVGQSSSAAEHEMTAGDEALINEDENESNDVVILPDENEQIDDLNKEGNRSIVDGTPTETSDREKSMELSMKESPVVDAAPKDTQVRDAPAQEIQTKESHPKELSVKKVPGTITILKRSEKPSQHTQESAEDSTKTGTSATYESKSKDRKGQLKGSSKSDSEKLMLQLGISPSTALDERSGVVKKKEKQIDIDDIFSSRYLGISTKRTPAVETGNLLDLDYASSVPSEEKKPTFQESTQPTGLILKMLQDQQNNISQLTKTIEDLSTKLSEQMRINEKLNKLLQDERENNKIQKSTATNINKISKDISKTSQRVDSITSLLQSTVQQTLDNQMQAMFQAVNTSIGTKLEKSIKSEFRASLTPNVQKLVNATMDQVSDQFSTRLGALEKVVRDEMAVLVKSKSVAESIGFNAGTILEGVLPDAYQKAFRNILIPSYERSCNEMFSQISREFEKGTRSYFQKMDGYFETRKQKQVESRDPVLKQMQDLSQTFQDTADRLTGIESNLQILMQKQISDAFTTFQGEFSTSLEHRLSKTLLPSFLETVESSFSQVKSLLTSLTQGMAVEHSFTEESMESRLQKLDTYLSEYEYAKAFEEALNAVDLTFVLYVCQRIDAEELFSKKSSCLEQQIILSLIQQLSIDLTNETELKVNYLSEAIEALDTSHDITATHMASVLDSLLEQVESAVVILKSGDEPNKQHLQQLSMLRKLIRAKHK